MYSGQRVLSNVYDPRLRPWFQKALDANGEMARTNAYYWSPDDAVIVSTVKAVRDERGTIFGVQGMDVSLKGLASLLNRIKLGKTGYIMLIEDTGKILVDRQHPQFNFKEFVDVENGLFSHLNDVDSGRSSLVIDDTNYLINVFVSPELSWKFIALIQEAEILDSANEMKKIIATITFVLIFIFVFIAVLLSRFINGQIEENTKS
jgi:methyl-accepting chemotaxis protein